MSTTPEPTASIPPVDPRFTADSAPVEAVRTDEQPDRPEAGRIAEQPNHFEVGQTDEQPNHFEVGRTGEQPNRSDAVRTDRRRNRPDAVPSSGSIPSPSTPFPTENSLSTALSNTWVLSGRMIKHNLRSLDTILTVVAMPLMILLAFVFVLGGAMQTGTTRYVDYIVPVVLLLCIASGVAYTAYHVNQDVASGMFDRFRTMPIAHSSLVGGHLVASVVANAVSVIIIIGFALICGYRPHPGPGGWLVWIALLVLTLIAFSIMGAAFGLLAKSTDGASVFSYLLMALLFVSSGFAPTSTMKAGLRAFADYQPMTPVINALRDAQFGEVHATTTLIACGWLVLIIAVFAVLSVMASKHTRHRSA